MRYLKITSPDINNGSGFRVTLWVAGCTHHCKGCHNQDSWSFKAGKEFTQEDKEHLFDILEKPHIKGLTLSGGDPLCSYEDVWPLAMETKKRFPKKDIWLFTGFTLDFVKEKCPDILNYVDFVVDGPFIKTERDITIPFRGSRNQRIWKRLENGEWQVADDKEFNLKEEV